MKSILAIAVSAFVVSAANAMPPLETGRLSTRPPILVADSSQPAAAEATDFLFRLGMLEGHLMIGHELLRARQPALALPHFGHPLSELYDDLADYLAKNKFPPFDKQLARLEAAVTTAPNAPSTEQRYQEVIATVHKAREVAPAALRASLPEMIQICSDTIDAASGEFGEALEQGRVASVVEYHDSKGYLQFVQLQLDELRSLHTDAHSQSLLERFQAILAKAEWIVAPLLPEAEPRASLNQYRDIAAEAARMVRQ